jgi:WD40 repeat protein/tRNA A-37 threonylcarbamoyl transferase component Bud32
MPEPDAIDMESGADTSGSSLSFGGMTEFLARSGMADRDTLPPGTRLGEVVIIRLVGVGGMGRVYEGLQGMPCRTVAVKVMRPGALSPAVAKRFEHEAHILGRLTHPGIARIYSVGMEHLSSGTVPYFVMEYIDDARSITVHVAERNLSIRERVQLFREACRAVAHGHHKGVIHRDLKPGNILVDAQGQPKVIDFGVARSTDGDVALTTMHTDVGQLVGTLQYMSPEQFDGSSDDLDVRADVYALGVVLFELLTGRLPYEVTKRAVYEVAHVVKQVEPTLLSAINPALRGDLQTIVAKCLEKDRGRRYSSAAELEADLGRHLRGEPIAASPPQLVDSLVRLTRRHRWAATAVAGVTAAILVAVVGISIFALRAERQRVLAVDEGERANAASQEAIRQLYVANLRSLQAALEKRNLRLARQLHAENLAIVGMPPPLEMLVLGADIDDALVVIDPRRGPVGEIAYSPDGDTFGATVFVRPRLLSSDEKQKRVFVGLPSTMLHSKLNEAFFFSVESHQRYKPLQACAEEWVQLWRAEMELAKLPQPMADGAGVPLAGSPDGVRMAIHDGDGGVRILNRSKGTIDAVLPEHRSRLRRVMFNPGGNRLAILSQTGVLELWDAGSGGLVMKCGEADAQIQSFQFSPDGSRIACVTGSLDRSDVRVHDAVTGRQLSTVPTLVGISIGKSAILAFTPAGDRIVTASHETDLHMWDVATGRSLAVLKGHVGVVTAVACSAQGSQIASGAINGHIRIWDANTGALEGDLMGHDGAIMALAFAPDGETLASGSHDGTVRLWSRSTAEPLAVLPGIRGMTAIAFSPDGRQFAVAPNGTGNVEIWNTLTVERACTFATAGATVTQLAFSPAGESLAAACKTPGQPGEVRLWRTDSQEPLPTLGGHGNGAERLAFSPDGTRILTVSGDSVATVWDPSTGHKIMAHACRYKGHFGDLDAVFGLDGKCIVYRSAEMVDAATGDILSKLPPQGHVSCRAVSPDGSVLATGVASGNVYLADFATANRFAQFTGHTNGVRTIAFSPDGSRLATGSNDGTARLWDVSGRNEPGLFRGEERRVFRGHESGVEVVKFTPDGRRIVTGANDGTVRIWDADQGHELCVLPGQRDYPQAFALSPDGMLLVTAASDGTTRIWGLSNAAVTQARAAAAAGPGAAAPRASRETPPDQRDPAG